MANQYGRKISLLIGNDTKALDMSALRVVFKTTQHDVQSPNRAIIRVYNLSDSTANLVNTEFTSVVLQAGYEGSNYGVIFQGTIVQTYRGRENATSDFLDIFVSDGDAAYNQTVVNFSLAAGASAKDQANALIGPMKAHGVIAGDISALDGIGTKLPRGKSFFGMARDYLQKIATTNGMVWSIQDGKVIMFPLTGYLPGDAVKLAPATGLIGIPTQTEDGIRARCLLNPLIKVGTRVQIDRSLIAQFGRTISDGGIPAGLSVSLPTDSFAGTVVRPSVAGNGFYRVLLAEYSGDSRGNDWYTDIICIGVDATLPPSAAVRAFV